jgi:hypothetical protein
MILKSKNRITFNFDWKSSVFFFFGFVLFTPIGTVSHEAGHYLVAQQYFKKPTLHYGYVVYGEWERQQEMNKWFTAHSDNEGNVFNEDSRKLESYRSQARRHGFYSTFGGPLQTMLFGTIGVLILYFRKKRRFKFLDWLAVFLAYFWSREVFIFLSLSLKFLINGTIAISSDEAVIAHYLETPLLVPAAIFGCLGIMILTYVTFMKIPIRKRFTFIVSGILGSIVGFILWLEILGPILMP